MSRSTLHTPFAQQHSAGTSSSSRVSPFQQAAATLQSLESDDLESGWSNNHYGPGLRQRYLDVFEPLRTTARSSSGGGMRDRGGHDQLQRNFRTAPQPGPTHLRIVLTEDAMHSSTQPHIIRARAILTTSSSARDIHTSTPAHLTGSVNTRLRASTSLDGAAGSSSSHHSSSGSSGGSNTSLRRLQRRSSSLLAATSATASNLWSSISALGDRSRALLCRNSPVLHHGAEPGAPSSSSSGGRDGGRRSSVSSDGGARSSVSSDGVSRSGSGVVSLGVALEAGPGAVVGSGRTPRFSQRLLLRSTAIRRSSGARSPAVLIDIDATDSYDDLLALDQFNVKRAVKASVLKGLPCRTPTLQDMQQQRQCHICFEAWVPLELDDDVAGSSGRDTGQQQQPMGAAAAVTAGEDGEECCCQYCSQRQAMPDIVQLLCWDGPTGRHQVLVPAPAPARLQTDDVSFGDGASSRTPPPSNGSAGSSSVDVWSSPYSSSSGEGVGASAGSSSSQWQPVVRGWAPLVGGQGGVSTRHVGPARVEPAAGAAAAAAGGSGAFRQGQPVWTAAVHPRWGTQGHSSQASGSSRHGHGCSGSCSRGRQGGAADQHTKAGSGVQIQQLPCGHEFCAGCIQPWLREHISCPVCRWTFAEADTRLINK